MSALYAVNFAISCYLLGLILTIQFVHYPGFLYVDKKHFHKFHLFHTRRIGLIVMAPMIVELITSGLLVYYYPGPISISLLILVILIWTSTALLSVPKHSRLAKEKNLQLINELVRTNWPRTILWSLRVFILAIVIIRASS